MTEPEQKSRSGNAATSFLAARWGSVVLVILAAIFVGQNREDVSLHLLWVTVTAPNWVVLAALFVLGALSGALWRSRRKKK